MIDFVKHSASVGEGKSKDFRESLFSIFVDNLNFKVEQRCLWDVFKPFGKVRDVFLSMEKRSRRSKFAFVRFESLQEAAKVAKSTDGMLVYGWPIVSKVATYGWSNRRVSQANQRTSYYEEKSQSSRGGGDFGQRAIEKERSFVDIVRGFQDKSFKPEVQVEEDERMLKLSWDCRQREQEWLSRCAVGVLKNFAEVSRVNQRLRDAGFAFSSSYMGDKSILWCLDSISHKEAFIYNKFMWEDSFSAMVRWSDSVIPQARLAWINCWGAPLSCWSSEFFKNLGWKVGEPLLVEEEVENRNRLDRGRMLVLVPQSKLCSTNVMVEVGQKSYVVKLEEDCAPVDVRWTERFLGLSKFQLSAGEVMSPTVVSFQNIQSKAVGEFASPRKLQADMGKVFPSQFCKFGLKKQCKLGVGNVNRLKGVSAKGKMKWVGKVKKKSSVGATLNGKLNIDKGHNLVISCEESSSSSDVSLGISFFKDSLKARGESSSKQDIQTQNGGPSKSKKVSFCNLPISPEESQIKENSIELCVDLGLVEVSSSKVLHNNMLKSSLEVAKDPIVSSENGNLKEALVESIVAIEEERDILVHISEAAEEEAVVEENESWSALSSVNSESREEMVNLVVGESEEDLVLASSVGGIKQARPNGGGNQKSKGSSSYNMRTRNAKAREVAEIEAAKVMVIGSALGLDFSEVDEEMLEEITRREEEDVARYEAMSAHKRKNSKVVV